jgi:hypothetical protein
MMEYLENKADKASTCSLFLVASTSLAPPLGRMMRSEKLLKRYSKALGLWMIMSLLLPTCSNGCAKNTFTGSSETPRRCLLVGSNPTRRAFSSGKHISSESRYL